MLNPTNALFLINLAFDWKEEKILYNKDFNKN